MSQIRWQRQLALAAILFVLGGFAYWLQFKHKPEMDDEAAEAKKLIELDKKQVETVQISNGASNGAAEITLHCTQMSSKLCRPGDNSKWELLDPLKVKADDANANSLLSTVNNLNPSDTIPLKDETADKRAALLKEYGLDPASLRKDRRMEIDSPSGTTVFYLGATHPIGEGIFSAVERVAAGAKPTGKIDETLVYVLPSYFKASFDHELTYWRDKKVLPIQAHEVTAFALKNSKDRISGERKNGEWILTSLGHGHKDVVSGDTDAMDSLLTGATYLVARNFISENKKDAKARKTLAGAKKVVTFSLTTESSKTPTVLTLYEKKQGKAPAKGAVHYAVYATVSTMDPLYELDSYSKERLDKGLAELRLTKLITSMDRFSAQKLQLESSQIGQQPWVLLNKDGKWMDEAAKAPAIDGEKVQDFLDKLSSSRIVEFITKKFPEEGSKLVVTLGDSTQPVKRKIAFWRVIEKTGAKLYARDLLSKRKEVFLMDNSLIDAIPWVKASLETQSPRK